MRFSRRLSRMATALSLGLLAACGSGSTDNATGNNPAQTFRADAGVAQKGPLISGSTVTVQELDPALSPTGRQFSYQISSDLGTFSPTSSFNSQYLGVNATGYYFDEVLGATSTGTVTLTSYNDLSTDSTLNVNLLTTLAYQRVRNLMTNAGMTFAAARTQAEGEVLGALGIPMGNYGSFGTLDLKGNGDGDRLLAAISGLFVNGNHAGNLSTLINNFQSDIGDDGALTNSATKAALTASAATLNPGVVAANLTNRYASLGVTFDASDLAPWIDSDSDGVVGKFEFHAPDASPATQFTLPATVVSNLVGKSITASDGLLIHNGAPVSGAATIAANDVLAVSPGVGSFPDGVLNVYLLSQSQRMANVSFVSGLLSIDVTPAMASIATGLSQQFVATGHFSDGSTADLTQNVAWSSSNAAVAAINTSGLATSLALGNTTVTATSGSIAGSETLTVTAAELESFAITPSIVRSGVGLTVHLTATGTYTDATTANVTSQANWSSNDPSIATINAQTGVATGVALGATTIEATIGSLTQTAPIAIVTNEFTAGPSLPSPFSGHTATLLANGKLVVIGGAPTWGEAPVHVAIYDPTTQSWSPGTNTILERSEHTSVLLPNGNILVAGGNATHVPTSAAELYDPVNDQWTSVPNMSTARRVAGAVLLPNNRVLVAGGASGGSSADNLNSAQLFDPVTNTWLPVPNMTNRRSSHTMTLLANGKVLVAGGASNSGMTTETAELYDSVTNSWSPAGSMSIKRTGHTATLLTDGRVLVAGGTSSGSGVTGPAQAEIYDPASNTWSPTGTLSYGRVSHTASLLPDGRVLVAGGVVLNSFGATDTTEVYDPATGAWSAGPAMTVGRQKHTATTLLNNVILLVGGMRVSPAELASTELYW